VPLERAAEINQANHLASVMSPEHRQIIQNYIAANFSKDDKSRSTLFAFDDAECPFCDQADRPLDKLVSETTVNFHLIEMPSPMHPFALFAAKLETLALLKGKFVQFHPALYSTMFWSKPVLIHLAGSYGITPSEIESEANSGPVLDKLKKDKNFADALQVDATPTFILVRSDGDTFTTHSVDQLTCVM